MSTTVAALFATLIATGMTSAVHHQWGLIGGSAASLLFGLAAMFSRNASIYPTFLLGSIAMSILALISAEVNTAALSSTIHVLSCYIALAGLAFSSVDLSRFCRQFMMTTNLLLTAWILHQGMNAAKLEAWQISNPSGAGNLMAAQINMTIPLVLALITRSTGIKRLVMLTLLLCNCIAVILMMSRNGIGAMLILLTLYVLFNYRKLACLSIVFICTVVAYSDSITHHPFVYELLVRMRIINFVPKAPRSVIWEISLDQILANPSFGVGPGEPRRILSVLDIYHAHNNIIQVALETGLPSAAIFAIMVVLLLWLPFRASMAKQEVFVPTLSILAYLIYAWTGAPLALPGATLLLVACVNEARVAVHQSNGIVTSWDMATEMRALQRQSSHA